jgi:hypothetical protein
VAKGGGGGGDDDDDDDDDDDLSEHFGWGINLVLTIINE